VSEAGAVWLLINPGAAAQGTGEAQVAKANDAYATYYNPAGLGFMDGENVVLQHVNWLPNLVSDIFYDFIGYTNSKNGTGFGGHLIYINLGEQQHTGDGPGEEFNFGTFKSFDICLTGSYGTRIASKSAVGFNFKVYHQKLAPFTTQGEVGRPYSTDVAFDVSFLQKFGKFSQHNFGLAIQNIGPPVSFVDAEQADPAPTNMKFGIYSRLYKDDYNTLHMMFDANKLLVATYTEMDWDNDGIIGNGYKKEINDDCAMYASDSQNYNDCDNPYGDVDEDGNLLYYKPGWVSPTSSQLKEYTHSDEWYKAVYTSWLNDWYYGGDLNRDRPATFLGKGNVEIGYNEYDKRIGGYRPAQFAFQDDEPLVPYEFPGAGIPGGVDIYVPNYLNFCIEDPANCYTADGILIDENNYDINNLDPNLDDIAWIDLPHDGLNTETQDIEVYGCTDLISNTQENCEAGNLDDDEETDEDESANNEAWVVVGFETVYGDNNYAPGVYSNLLEIHPDYLWSTDNNACDQDPSTETPTCYFDIAYDGEYDFTEDEYGSYNVWGYKEKGSGDNRKFSDEFKEMIYNVGFEWWYTDNFVMRLGYMHDDEGQVKQPTFGAGVHFSGYGFDFGYTAGSETDSRSNTMFFSLALNL